MQQQMGGQQQPGQMQQLVQPLLQQIQRLQAQVQTASQPCEQQGGQPSTQHMLQQLMQQVSQLQLQSELIQQQNMQHQQQQQQQQQNLHQQHLQLPPQQQQRFQEPSLNSLQHEMLDGGFGGNSGFNNMPNGGLMGGMNDNGKNSNFQNGFPNNGGGNGMGNMFRENNSQQVGGIPTWIRGCGNNFDNSLFKQESSNFRSADDNNRNDYGGLGSNGGYKNHNDRKYQDNGSEDDFRGNGNYMNRRDGGMQFGKPQGRPVGLVSRSAPTDNPYRVPLEPGAVQGSAVDISVVQGLMKEYEKNASTWGNAAPALTGKEIGADETDLTEARVWGDGEIAAPYTTFNSCKFPKPIMASIFSMGFSSPTPIQAYCWPVAGAGRDLIGIAKTGSGKTLAFLLPPFSKFLGSRAQSYTPGMLVMAPTRELACQIQAEAERFGRCIGVSSVCIYGGAPRGPQLREIRQGRHLVVGTPGRLNDCLEVGQLHLNLCTYLVLDEADRMLDMGFEPQIRTLIQATPLERQTMMFSATWPREVRQLAQDYLQSPVHVQIGSHEATANKDIQQEVLVVANIQEKFGRLREVLRNVSSADRVIIFVNMKRMCEQLAQELWTERIRCATIHGDREQRERDQALNAFKTGRSPILVATDVAARGLDIKGVKIVVSFDVASSAEDHIHRIGRTGRAGVPGLAITFLDFTEGRQAKEVMSTMEKVGQPIPLELSNLAKTHRPSTNFRNGKGFGKGYGKGHGKGGGKGRYGGSSGSGGRNNGYGGASGKGGEGFSKGMGNGDGGRGFNHGSS